MAALHEEPVAQVRVRHHEDEYNLDYTATIGGSTLMHHGGKKGVQILTPQTLHTIPVPEATETYQPVPYEWHRNTLVEVANSHLRKHGYKYAGEEWLSVRYGKRLFGLLVYQNGNTDQQLAIATTNSYDKHVAIKIAAGARVFVCSNMAIASEINYVRKHTPNVLFDAKDLMQRSMVGVLSSYQRALEDERILRSIPCSDREFYEFTGLCFGNDVLTPWLMNPAIEHWTTCPFPEYDQPTMWKAYQCCTWALKRYRDPAAILEKHATLRTLLLGENLPESINLN